MRQLLSTYFHSQTSERSVSSMNGCLNLFRVCSNIISSQLPVEVSSMSRISNAFRRGCTFALKKLYKQWAYVLKFYHTTCMKANYSSGLCITTENMAVFTKNTYSIPIVYLDQHHFPKQVDQLTLYLIVTIARNCNRFYTKEKMRRRRLTDHSLVHN